MSQMTVLRPWTNRRTETIRVISRELRNLLWGAEIYPVSEKGLFNVLKRHLGSTLTRIRDITGRFNRVTQGTSTVKLEGLVLTRDQVPNIMRVRT